jgi:hypothetical protein
VVVVTSGAVAANVFKYAQPHVSTNAKVIPTWIRKLGLNLLHVRTHDGHYLLDHAVAYCLTGKTCNKRRARKKPRMPFSDFSRECDTEVLERAAAVLVVFDTGHWPAVAQLVCPKVEISLRSA